MGKIVCKSHGTQVLSFVSKFHQKKIAGAEPSHESEIRYVEVDNKEENIQGTFLVDPNILTQLDRHEKVSKMKLDSSEFNKIFSDLQAVCSTCLKEYLARKI